MLGNPIAVTTTHQLFNTGLHDSEYILIWNLDLQWVECLHASSAIFNEISVGMISSCPNEAHSCFIDHEMLPIILVFVYQVSSLIFTQPL